MQTRYSPYGEGPPPSEAQLRRRFGAEGLEPYRWENRAGETYAPHTHLYDKVVVVVRGTITFGLPSTGERIELAPGDRLDLPAGVEHDAVVGADGVVCLEAQSR
jgi:quercetin dioxygenase-like cupin family protein